jgi:hypothetical protein
MLLMLFALVCSGGDTNWRERDEFPSLYGCLEKEEEEPDGELPLRGEKSDPRCPFPKKEEEEIPSLDRPCPPFYKPSDCLQAKETQERGGKGDRERQGGRKTLYACTHAHSSGERLPSCLLACMHACMHAYSSGERLPPCCMAAGPTLDVGVLFDIHLLPILLCCFSYQARLGGEEKRTQGLKSFYPCNGPCCPSFLWMTLRIYELL